MGKWKFQCYLKRKIQFWCYLVLQFVYDFMFVDLSVLQIAFLFPTYLFSRLFLHYRDTQNLCICIRMAFNMSLLLSLYIPILIAFCLLSYFEIYLNLLVGIQQHSPYLGGDPKLIHYYWRKWWWFDKGLEGTYCCSKEDCRFTSGTSRSKGDIVDILMNSSIFLRFYIFLEVIQHDVVLSI